MAKRKTRLTWARKAFAKLGWVVLTDSVDDRGETWPFAIRHGSIKIYYQSYELLLTALKCEKNLASKGNENV